MDKNIKKAVRILRDNSYTFCAVNHDIILSSSERGIKPLLELLDGKRSLHGFSVADKVIGKAGAFIYVLLAPDEIYADVISSSAFNVLERYRIPIKYGTLTEAIRNRTNTGLCPMETAVKDAENPENALLLIREKIFQFSK